MLKPKYGNINESVSDFNRMLEGMNATQPLDRYEVDKQVRERQEEERLRQQLRHIESVLAGSGHFFTEREKSEWYTKRAQIAEMLGEDPEPMEESVYRPAVQRNNSAMSRYRMLAGLDESVNMPRDAGIFGSTRHNANYDEMADERFDEAAPPKKLWPLVQMAKDMRDKADAAKKNPKGIAIRPEDDVASKPSSVSKHGPWKQAPKKESSNRFRGISRLAMEGGPSRRSKEGRQMAHAAQVGATPDEDAVIKRQVRRRDKFGRNQDPLQTRVSIKKNPDFSDSEKKSRMASHIRLSKKRS